MNAIVVSEIEAILQNHLVQRERLEGLHFAAFLPRDANGAPGESASYPKAANTIALRTMLHVYGLRHGPEQQVRLWEDRILEVHRSFETLNNLARSGTERKVPPLTRLVLDADVGGVFYATVGDHGWIFAATLNQQGMNSGRAEEHLLAIVSDVRSLVTTQQSHPGVETAR